MVRLSRSSQQRASRGRCGVRRSGTAPRSASASAARRASRAPALTCRRQTDTTSTSTSSGAVSRSPRNRARAWSPSGPSSPRQVAKTLASTTITVGPQRRHRRLQRHRTTRAAAGMVEDLIERWLAGLFDEPGAQVFLQRLMRSGCALAQDRVGLLRHILDLHTGHSAIMALEAPIRNHPPSSACALGLAANPGQARRRARSNVWLGPPRKRAGTPSRSGAASASIRRESSTGQAGPAPAGADGTGDSGCCQRVAQRRVVALLGEQVSGLTPIRSPTTRARRVSAGSWGEQDWPPEP